MSLGATALHLCENKAGRCSEHNYSILGGLDMYDVAVIGGGIIGTAVAEILSRYELRICLLEKGTDVAEGTSKANSGIVHAGYDAGTGTLMAKMNVRGASLIEPLCRKLGVAFRRCGSYVLSFSEEEDEKLEELLRRGEANGVRGLEILDGDTVRLRVPHVSRKVRSALWAPSAGIVDPMRLAAALAETAALNGTDFFLSSEVTSIRREEDHFVIQAGDAEKPCRYIVNAAGVHADRVHEMAGGSGFHIRPVRGEYFMMDKCEGGIVSSVMFQCPTKAGKGVLCAPTVHGNLIVGPNAEEVEDGCDTATTADGLAYVHDAASKSVPDIDFSKAIRNFAGVRAYSDTGDFIISLSSQVPHFVNLAGICSPGLTSAPAIAEECVRILEEDGLRLEKRKEHVLPEPVPRVGTMPHEERDALVRKDPRYGHVICRCETITEGEIVNVLHRAPVSGTVDSIKKRLGAGMGRCQGGFCMPRILRIISEELGTDPYDILKGAPGSRILCREEKQGEHGGDSNEV